MRSLGLVLSIKVVDIICKKSQEQSNPFGKLFRKYLTLRGGGGRASTPVHDENKNFNPSVTCPLKSTKSVLIVSIYNGPVIYMLKTP